MIGEIVETYKSFWNGTTTIHYILKIKLTYYVNIGQKGVEFVEKAIWESSVKEDALDELRSYKEKLDLELITQDEYDKKKEELKQYIL